MVFGWNSQTDLLLIHCSQHTHTKGLTGFKTAQVAAGRENQFWGPWGSFGGSKACPSTLRMRSYKILSGFNRFLMAKNLGNKKSLLKSVNVYTRYCGGKPVSESPGELWRLQIAPQHPQIYTYTILSGFNWFLMVKNLETSYITKFNRIGQWICKI